MLYAMFQNIAAEITFSLYLFILLCYVLCFKTQRSKFHFLCISLFCYAMSYVSKQSCQNFIFSVFLYFDMLFAIFQNIAVKISFSLYFFILLCYMCFVSIIAARISYPLFVFCFVLFCLFVCFLFFCLFFFLFLFLFVCLFWFFFWFFRLFVCLFVCLFLLFLFLFLFCYAMCYVSEHNGQKFISFVFFSILLCYALHIHFKAWRSSFFCFVLFCFVFFSLFFFAIFWC